MKKKIFITILAIIGILTTIKLAVIYYNANFNQYALPSFCSVSDFVDCDGIAKTSESQFFGVPLAYWGMFFYAFVLLLLAADKLKKLPIFKFLEVFKNPMAYIASLGLISFVISITLLCLSLFKIHKLCILCAFTYILNLLIGLVAVDFKAGKFMDSIKQSFKDFIDAIANRVYLVAFVLVMLAAGGFLTYTTISLTFAPQLKWHRAFSEFETPNKKYSVQGNTLGQEGAKVLVYTYSDYQCPICPVHNNIMHKLGKEMKDVVIIHKNLPLDTDCNKYLTTPFHHGSCVDAKYALAAEKQGKFWEMNDLLFEKKPKTEAEILNLIKDMDFDIEQLQKDANSSETSEIIKKDIDEAYKMGINATPTTMINNQAYVGLKTYKDYVQWVKEIEQK